MSFEHLRTISDVHELNLNRDTIKVRASTSLIHVNISKEKTTVQSVPFTGKHQISQAIGSFAKKE